MTLHILVTNDDGIDSPGLHALVAALEPLGRVSVVAPDRNRSAVSRSITLAQMLVVSEEDVPGAHVALATDGTPTDCVRLAALGLAGDRPDLVVSGANQGLNVGDDVTYSGTVAAAFEANLNGIPAIAVSQQEVGGGLGYPRSREFDWRSMRQFIRPLAELMITRGSELASNLLNVNIPGLPPDGIAGVEVQKLGRRIYRDKLTLHETEGGRRHFTLYGDDPSYHDEPDTDIAAIGRGCITVTPLRFQLDDVYARSALEDWALSGLLQ